MLGIVNFWYVNGTLTRQIIHTVAALFKSSLTACGSYAGITIVDDGDIFYTNLRVQLVTKSQNLNVTE